jgi:tetratricopeptide (TPR) repeat protein
MSKLSIEECKKILQLPDNYNLKILKKNFHMLSKKYHPDIQTSKNETNSCSLEKFLLIKKAYETLLTIVNDKSNDNVLKNSTNETSKINHEYFYKKGVKFFKEGDINNAIECYNRALQFDKNNTNYERAIIKCLMLKERRLLEAKERCIELTKKETFNPENFFLLAKIYQKAGFNDIAKEIFIKTKEMGFNEKLINKEIEKITNSNTKKSIFAKIFKMKK